MMQRSKLIYVIFLAGLLVLFFSVSALADAAPPHVPDGENINPGEGTTMVQMVKEEILIDVSMTRELFYYITEDDYWEGNIVAYNCTYWMVNQGTDTENLGVRFPLNTYYNIGKINIHSIKVNDQPVSWTEVENDKTDIYDWARFDAVFPPGEEVEIKITYTTVTCVYDSSCGVSYTLETGAGWYGPIGEGRIILRLPYKATSENVFLRDFRPAEGVFSDSDIYWDFTDLEPTSEDNWGMGIVEPKLWLDIVAERNRLEDSPNNVSALYRLADYLSRASISVLDIDMTYAYYDDEIGIASSFLYDEGLKTIKKTISLNPEDLKSHELYLLYLRADNGRADNSTKSLLLMLEEAEIILELDPENKTAANCREYALRKLERYQTATEYAIATPTPTLTPLPSATSKIDLPSLAREPEQDSSPTITPTKLVTPETAQEEPPIEKPNNALVIILVPTLIILLLLGGIAAIRAMNRK